MTLSGQCPNCRNTIAFSKAVLHAAPITNPESVESSHLIQCHCEANLIAVDAGHTGDIAAQCCQCQSGYVVDRCAAGEQLHCRCGAIVTIPTAILIAIQIPIPVTSHVDILQAPSASNETEVGNPDTTDIAGKHATVASSPLLEQIDCRLPIVATPELFQIGPVRDRLVRSSQNATTPQESNSTENAASPRSSDATLIPDSTHIADASQSGVANSCHESAAYAHAPSPTEYPTEHEYAHAPSLTEHPTEHPTEHETIASTPRPQRIDPITISCPGCKNEYIVAKSELGQTAECECGFVFVMQSNLSALDSALCSDLMPYLPLALDRTGAARTGVVSNATERRSSDKYDLTSERGVAVKFDSKLIPQPQLRPNLVDSRPDRPDLVHRYRRTTPIRLMVATVSFLATSAIFGYLLRESWGTNARLMQLPPVSSQWVNPIPEPTAPSVASGGPDLEAVDDQPADALSPFLLPIRKLARQLDESGSLPREPLYQFSEAINRLDVSGAEFTVKDLFWIATTWERFGVHAENIELRAKCYRQAASAYALAQTLSTIESPDRMVARERQQSLSQLSHDDRQISTGLGSEDGSKTERR